MKRYKIELTRQAEKAFLRIFLRIYKRNKKLAGKISNVIDELAVNPKYGIPLVGKLKGFWEIRVGDYRIIYFWEKKLTIYVIDIGHRRDVYR